MVFVQRCVQFVYKGLPQGATDLSTFRLFVLDRLGRYYNHTIAVYSFDHSKTQQILKYPSPVSSCFINMAGLSADLPTFKSRKTHKISISNSR